MARLKNWLSRDQDARLLWEVEEQTKHRKISSKTMNLYTSSLLQTMMISLKKELNKCKKYLMESKTQSLKNFWTASTYKYRESMTTTVKTARLKAIELGHVLSKPKAMSQSSAVFVEKTVILLQTVPKSKPTSKNKKLIKLRCYSNLNIRNSKKISM